MNKIPYYFVYYIILSNHVKNISFKINLKFSRKKLLFHIKKKNRILLLFDIIIVQLMLKICNIKKFVKLRRKKINMKINMKK